MAKKYHSGRKLKSRGNSMSKLNNTSAPGNCPTEVIMEMYPEVDYLRQYVDDSLAYSDMISDNRVRKANKQSASGRP